MVVSFALKVNGELIDSRAHPPLDMEALKAAIAAAGLDVKLIGSVTDTERLDDAFKLCFLNEVVDADLDILKNVYISAYGRMDAGKKVAVYILMS